MNARGLLGSAVLCLGLASCDDGPQIEVTADATFLFALDPGERTRLELTGFRGSVSVRGDFRETNVVVAGTRRVRAANADLAGTGLLQLEVDTGRTEQAVVVRTVQPEDDPGKNYEVDYEVTVPPGLAVWIVHEEGNVLLEETAGDVSVDAARGNVAASVSLPPGGSVGITVGEGDLALRVPAATSAAVDAATLEGTVTVSGLPLVVEERTEGSVTGTLGAGEGAISLRVARGDILLGER